MKESRAGSGLERVAFYAFIVSVAFAIFAYGYAVGSYGIFPRSILKMAKGGFLEIRTQLLRVTGYREETLPWYYLRVEKPYPPPILNTGRAFPGVNLVTGMGPDLTLFAKIMDMDGRTLHEWNLGWFRIWPGAKHLPADLVPRSKPGTGIHGAVILESGDLIFNFESLGMVRMNRRDEVVWRLPYRTHHSIQMDGDGNLWACGTRRRERKDARYPFREPPFDEYTIVVVSQRGEILHEWVIEDIIFRNSLLGLYNITQPYRNPVGRDGEPYRDDRLHMNDVEPFPATMEEGLFRRGDVMVSLRHVNTVLVFNRETGKIKYISTGTFTHQHDPDFIDGNTFSVFDNGVRGMGSRIAVVRATPDSVTTAYSGSVEHPFFSDALGKHQWLPNGNLLVTDATNGRAFEVNGSGEIVWEYRNYVDEGVLGAVSQVTRLPERYAEIFR